MCIVYVASITPSYCVFFSLVCAQCTGATPSQDRTAARAAMTHFQEEADLAQPHATSWAATVAGSRSSPLASSQGAFT